MKTKSILRLQFSSLAAGALMSWMTPAMAVVVEKDEAAANPVDNRATITATGTVFSMEPAFLSVVMKGNPTPVRFVYDKTTPFLDEMGVVVPLDLIRPDLPLTVHYAMEGDRMVARKVVLTRNMIAGDAGGKPAAKREELSEAKAVEVIREAEAQLKGPLTMMGTVTAVEQTVSLVLRGETQPVSCIINNSTRYINLSGQPVSGALVASGMPVTVKAVRDGNRVIAQEITVRGNPATLATPQAGTLPGSPSAGAGPAPDAVKGAPFVPGKPEGGPTSPLAK
jgi:hypothetical protein